MASYKSVLIVAEMPSSHERRFVQLIGQKCRLVVHRERWLHIGMFIEVPDGSVYVEFPDSELNTMIFAVRSVEIFCPAKLVRIVLDVRCREAAPYAIGSTRWPGLAKVAEEMAELGQLINKVIGCNGSGYDFTGRDIKPLMEDEIADVRAALAFLIETNDLDKQRIDDRSWAKLELFHEWHRDQAADPPDGQAKEPG